MRLRFFFFSLMFLSACVQDVVKIYEDGQDYLHQNRVYIEARDGNVEAQYRAGILNCCGANSLNNPIEALKWFCMAAKNDQRDATYMIGYIYDNAPDFVGYNLKRDKSLAMAYYQLALMQKQPDAEVDFNKLIEELSVEEVKEANILASRFPDTYCEQK